MVSRELSSAAQLSSAFSEELPAQLSSAQQVFFPAQLAQLREKSWPAQLSSAQLFFSKFATLPQVSEREQDAQIFEVPE
jgi:hypothetical protein